MSAGRYSFINAKLRAKKADFLTDEQWDALLGARDMQAAQRILETTGYSDLIKDFSAETTPIDVERALQGDFNRVLTEIALDVPGPVQSLMNLIKRKYHKEILKTLIRLHVTKSERVDADRLLIPMDPFTMDTLLKLLDASNLRILASQLPDPFFKGVIEEALPRYEMTNEVVILEQALDAAVLQKLFEQTQNLGGQDQHNTLPLVGLEIDLINLMITLRCQFLRIPSHEAEKLLLDIEYRLPLALCQRALQTRSLEESFQIFSESHYGDFVVRSREAYEHYQSLHTFEHTFNQYLRKASFEAMLGQPFHFGIILGFLNLKWFEILNLKAIMHGKADEIEPHIIRRTLVL